jgi:hypothetical protein
MISVSKFKISKKSSMLARNSNHTFKDSFKRIFSFRTRWSEPIHEDNVLKLKNSGLYHAHIPLEIELSLGSRAYNMSMYRL